ncbi:MAG: HAMP domain-containing histidine kinase [Firmicutes bacterium]|nr:HAMP domain-containing histidine kinase [Bacillota bacterium]MCL1953804.1 HAMP domain-containing histidine kinase [Bacillota bacterium]
MRKYITRATLFTAMTLFLLLVSIVVVAMSGIENSYMIVIIVLSVLSACLIVLWVIIDYSFLFRPLYQINKGADAIAKGNYSTRLQIHKGEIGIVKLIESINKIALDFQNLEEMRKSFVASASHELRSPLTSMQGFLQAIIDGTIDNKEEQDKYLNIVYGETKRLSGLINSMLDLSRMEYGNIDLVRSSFEIHETINQVVDKFSPTLLKKQSQIVTNFSVPNIIVFADKEKIVQVLINIIDNAIKYSPDFSKIHINTYVHNKRVYVIIKDNGSGISKKDQQFIWDKFYMVDKARTPNKTQPSTGLGLSIVKKIIEDHKETIWVESNLGEGSAFTFTLKIVGNKTSTNVVK